MERIQILSIATQQVYDIDCTKPNENAMPCPECSGQRKKQNAKSFSYNVSKQAGYCNHCEARFVLHKPYEEEKVFHVPTWQNDTKLNEKAVQWFEQKRMIPQRVLQQMGVCSKTAWMPQTQKEENTICFPYYRDGIVVNAKYRDAKKNFKLETGAELIWYNFDAIKNHTEIIICEGEIDALSFIANGFENVISVPNGASAKNLTYLDSSITKLEKVTKFILCTDNDTKGLELQKELIRRLGAEKCYIANLKQFKDANEYRLTQGHESLTEVVKNAKLTKIEGVFYADDFQAQAFDLWKNGMPKGKSIDFAGLDQLITWETKRLAVVTGTPGSGKSEFIDFILAKLNLIHGWKSAYWTPENYPLSYHYGKISEKISGQTFSEKFMNEATFWNTYNHIKENFFWVDPQDDYGLDNILAGIAYFVKMKGIKVAVIDPFNKIEQNDSRMDKNDFISNLLDKLIKFAKQHDILLFLVAHPRKLQKDKDGLYPIPTMYDISGSADFWNKSDYGLAVHREQDFETKALKNSGVCSIQKVKFKHLGKTGAMKWDYNFKNGRYLDLMTGSMVKEDNNNWLSNEIENETNNESKEDLQQNEWTPFD
jgi:twinkle protein